MVAFSNSLSQYTCLSFDKTCRILPIPVCLTTNELKYMYT